MRAGVDAVHTRHAAAVVHRMVLAVNTCRLALARTKSAGITFVLVYRNAQQGKTGQETEYRTYRTDSIAIGTSVPPRQYDDYDESNDGYKECRQTFQPHRGFIECIAVGTFGEIGKRIVAPTIKRSKEMRP